MASEKQDLSRRKFLLQTGLTGIAFVLGYHLPAAGKSPIQIMRGNNPGDAGSELMTWISIDGAGKVTIYSHRSEMGQGTWQAIPQVVAEELAVSMDQVQVKFAAANPQKYGPQPQEGSFSIRGWYRQLLNAGACARMMLVEAAANKWQVPATTCSAENGQVIHSGSGRKLPYSALISDAAKLTPPANIQLKPRSEYTLIGKPLKRNDTPFKTNGSAIFGLDKKLPGMCYAVVERNPRFRGKVKSFDDVATKKVRGVSHVFVVQRPIFNLLLEGVAIVADTLWAAMEGRKLLKVEWDDNGIDLPDTNELNTRMQDGLTKALPSPDFEAALGGSAHTTEAFYEAPYQSHSCMEPLNCIAAVKENSIEIWGPIQEANWIQADLSQRFQIPASNITVNMTFLGGGFGRKAFPDYPYEAAMISKEIKAPVQVMWTREDDMSMGPFRSGAFYRCRGGVNSQGNIHALQMVSASQYIGQGQDQPAAATAVSSNKGEWSGLPAVYSTSIPHYSFGGLAIQSHIPTMWWRAPIANVDAFASESFIDELAALTGQDSLVLRKKHLTDERGQALIDKLADFSRWFSRRKNEGWGVAVTECFGSVVGQVVKVSRPQGGKIRVDKVFAVIDCGWYVNPDTIRAQVEGSVVMALGAAISHATTFKNGAAVQKNFNTYQMPRINEIPETFVHIMENDAAPGGVGEPALPAFAPALCNAIFDLTGTRIRKLPFKPGDI
jgi:isoquinoline 1-oxidoreductase subunit beta